MRRGFFNFDRVVYRYYQDEAVATEAFKAGEFDIVRVYGASVWVRQHKGPKWDDGRIVKQAFPIGTGQGLQSYQLNLRRPMFQDIRVREALGLTYDFETNNRYRAVQAREQRVQQLRVRRRGAALARASLRCSSRSATSCRRRCSARRSSRRAPTATRTRCGATC